MKDLLRTASLNGIDKEVDYFVLGLAKRCSKFSRVDRWLYFAGTITMV